MRASRLALTISAIVAVTSSASADEEPDDAEKPQPATPAASPAPAPPAPPPPDQAGGIEQPDAVPIRTRALWLPRALLFIPRWVVWAVGQPIRGAAYAYERYELRTHVVDLLFDTTRTYGLYPVVSYETGFGVTGGARFVHRDLFGADERLKLRASFGGRYRQAYGLNLRSGGRLGALALEVDASFERRPLERFYGIGNGDEAPVPAMPIDPATSDAAVSTRFREDVIRNVISLEAPVAGALRARTSAATMQRALAGTGEADSLELFYDAARLVGWTGGVSNVYVEQQLYYDSRRHARYRSRAFDATGWFASVHVGATRGLGDDRSEFLSYGGEVLRYLDLYDGSRVLALRLLVESVAGTDGRTDGKISFLDLPRLGGAEYLRGYPSGRFRDRALTLATVEYAWDLGNFLAAYTFVDAGRVWRSLAELDELTPSSLRIGYGGGVQIHTDTSFLTRLQIAASRDGDVFLELVLSPAYGRRERAGRF